MPCWSMGRIGATATPTMTPSTPMKRESSPTRMALSEMIAMPKPSASAEVSQMSWPTSVAVGLSASVAAEFVLSTASTKSWAPR